MADMAVTWLTWLTTPWSSARLHNPFTPKARLSQKGLGPLALPAQIQFDSPPTLAFTCHNMCSCHPLTAPPLITGSNAHPTASGGLFGRLQFDELFLERPDLTGERFSRGVGDRIDRALNSRTRVLLCVLDHATREQDGDNGQCECHLDDASVAEGLAKGGEDRRASPGLCRHLVRNVDDHREPLIVAVTRIVTANDPARPLVAR